MARRNSRLENGIKTLRIAQHRLSELRASGTKDAEIRKVMLTLGLGLITPDQFLSAKTVEDFARLLDDGKPHAN
ncbi:MAG TPA: hypothetical protein VFE51_11140 [Verrucomicrobiae bacterium]|nr:hypothetical protein [Verrucomicrobiae bacterium]